MTKQEISIAGLGLFILLCVSYFANAQRLANMAEGNEFGFCKSEDSLCAYLTAPLRPILDQTIRQARSQTNADRVPVLKMYMTDGSIKKLNDKRVETVLENRAILLSGPDDWVRTDLVVQSEQGTIEAKARARLKGDWGDHIKHSRKRSLRISVRNGQTVLGTSRFSIQHPITRGYQHEALLFEAMRRQGVLTPRYFLVGVRLNDLDNGFMAFEEHFTKELIESQNRREGPILSIEEDQMWRQRFLNVNRSDVNWESYGYNFENALHYRPKDYPVRAYGKVDPEALDIKSNNAIRGMSLLRQALDGDVPVTEAFDLDLTASWFVLTNVFAATHGNGFHNLKFYFNPVTELMEPIAFDNHGDVLLPYKFKSTIFVDHMLTDSQFQEHLKIAMSDVEAMLMDDEFRAEFESIQARWLKLLSFDNMSADRLEIATLIENLGAFRTDLDAATQTAESENIGPYRSRQDHICNRTVLEIESPVHTHLRAFLYASDTGAYAEVKNLMHKPVKILELYRDGVDGPVRLASNVSIPVDDGTQDNPHIWRHDLGPYDGMLSNRHTVRFEFNGEIHEQELYTQFRYQGTIDEDSFFQDVADMLPTVSVERQSKTVTFGQGPTVLNKSYAITDGWSVVVKPGAQILLREGALLRVEGNFTAKGTQDEPIAFQIESAMDARLGYWGGLLVVGAAQKVEISHARFVGSGQSDLPQRQDNRGLTGCVTFYESDVQISSTVFDFMQCEDALNILRSEFLISESQFTRTHADAFDADFATGQFDGGLFSSTGNDGLDVSGSSVTISGTEFINIGDKAISVGEDSRVSVNDVKIKNAMTGLASKDKSNAEIQNTSFSEIQGSALIAYIKKQEYGPASIRCDDCTFDDVTSIATTQTASRILIDGVEQDVVGFSEQNLAEVGLVP